MKSHFSLALNNLKRRIVRAWLTVIGILIGIAAVVSLISLGQGLKEAITGQFSSLGTHYLTVQNTGTGFGPPGSTAVRKLRDHDLNLIEKVRGVESASAVLIRVGKIEYNKAVSFGYIRSISNQEESLKEEYSALNLKAQSGRLLKIGDNKKVLLGNNYAKDEKFGKAVDVGKKIKINNEEFEFVGILNPSGNIILNDVAIIFYDNLKKIFNIADEIDLIGVKVAAYQNVQQVANNMEAALRKDRAEKVGEEDFSVQTPAEILSSVNTILTIINVIVIGIACISLIVGGIGIANSMYTSVLERTKEIGTMKAIGARNSDILLIFLIESGLLGLVGGILGVILGMGVSKLIEVIVVQILGSNMLKITFNVWLVFGSLMFSFIIGILSGLLPARQASKLNPVDALRYE